MRTFLCFESNLENVGINLDSFTVDEIDNRYKQSPLYKLYFNFSRLTNKLMITDIFVWRPGIYIVLFLLFLFFCSIHGLYWIWIASVPFLANTLSWLLSLYHLSYRYVIYV